MKRAVKIQIRPQRLSDAKRFFDMLSNKNFIHFGPAPASIEAERKWLRQSKIRQQNKEVFNYAITLYGKVIGAIGIKVNVHRRFIGEIGYFVDEAYWGSGIATQAIKMIEKKLVKPQGFKRLEIIMKTSNKASEKVAIKNKYQKEGVMRKSVKDRTGKLVDTFLYSKIFK